MLSFNFLKWLLMALLIGQLAADVGAKRAPNNKPDAAHHKPAAHKPSAPALPKPVTHQAKKGGPKHLQVVTGTAPGVRYVYILWRPRKAYHRPIIKPGGDMDCTTAMYGSHYVGDPPGKRDWCHCPGGYRAWGRINPFNKWATCYLCPLGQFYHAHNKRCQSVCNANEHFFQPSHSQIPHFRGNISMVRGCTVGCASCPAGQTWSGHVSTNPNRSAMVLRWANCLTALGRFQWASL